MKVPFEERDFIPRTAAVLRLNGISLLLGDTL
jgi:hypothetical protein